jgi:hypothetical protein
LNAENVELENALASFQIKQCIFDFNEKSLRFENNIKFMKALQEFSNSNRHGSQ